MNNQKEMVTKEDRRAEYQEIGFLHRLYIGIRFGLLASFGTSFVVLTSGYNYVWVSRAVFGEWWTLLLIVVSAFGIMITLAALLIEQRTIFAYRACLMRGTKLEEEMNILSGIYGIITSPAGRFRVLGIPATHTIAISTLYFTIVVIWLILLGNGIYQWWLEGI